MGDRVESLADCYGLWVRCPAYANFPDTPSQLTTTEKSYV